MNQQEGGRLAAAYAWIVLAVLFVGQAASFGMRVSFGAYISPWEQDFSVGRTVVTTISTLNFIVFAVAQPLAGKLNDYLGKSTVPSVSLFLMCASLLFTSRATQMWQVFLFYGVGFSLGFAGCCNVIAAAIIPRWFVKKRGFALGLIAAGMAVGQLVLVPTNLFLIERLGWRSSMAALSIAILAVVGPLFVFLLRSSPTEKGMMPYGAAEAEPGAMRGGAEPPEAKDALPVLNVFRQKAFWLLSIPNFICGFTDVGLINTHLIPLAQGKGFPGADVAIAFSLIAVSSIGGAILTGHLSDHISRRRQLSVIFLMRAGTYIFLFFIEQPWLLLPFAVFYGAVDMASIAPTNSLAVQLFDRYSLGAVLGVIAVSHQIGGAAGSWVPGLLYDLTGSYDTVLILAVLLLFSASVLVSRVPEPAKDRRK